MKTLTANILCWNCKLYKIGVLIGFIYLIPNLLIVACIFLNGYYDYTLPLLCAVTVFSSILLLMGLMEERHQLLLPWLGNIAVLIVFNIILVTVQFDATNKVEVKKTFYLEFLFLFGLQIQILFWYIIYCLFKYGYDKCKRLNTTLNTISQNTENQSSQNFNKDNLIINTLVMVDKKVIKV